MSHINKILITFILLFSANVALSQILIPEKVKYGIVIDHYSGGILAEKNADQKISPASLTKIMTAVVVFDLLKNKKISLKDQFSVSKKAVEATRHGESKMFLMFNDKVSVDDLLKGLIIVSGVDAAIVLTEGISGNEESFIKLMNQKAKEIGMNNTNFDNSSGTYSKNNYSTVRDIAILSSYLINNYPKYYGYFSQKEFTWNKTGGEPIKQENRNTLLFSDDQIDGVKTGHLSDSKFSISVTKKIKNRRIIAVISGLPTMAARAESARIILNTSINKTELFKLPYNKDFFSIKIWNGSSSSLFAKGRNDDGIFYNLSKNTKKPKITAEIEYDYPLEVPIKKNQRIGIINIYNKKQLIHSEELFAAKDIGGQNIFFRGLQNINYYLWH